MHKSSKRRYLDNLNATIYIRDIIQRYNLKNDALLEIVADTAMSNIGCLTNPTKLSNAINSTGKLVCNETTVRKYLGYLESAFLIQNARLFDLRGNRYLDYPSKYYAVDTGIRNSRLNFRQDENTHLMENVIYNKLVRRDYAVDVGAVEMFATVLGEPPPRRYGNSTTTLKKRWAEFVGHSHSTPSVRFVLPQIVYVRSIPFVLRSGDHVI